MVDPLVELERLVRLRDAGALSLSEFEAEKRKLFTRKGHDPLLGQRPILRPRKLWPLAVGALGVAVLVGVVLVIFLRSTEPQNGSQTVNAEADREPQVSTSNQTQQADINPAQKTPVETNTIRVPGSWEANGGAEPSLGIQATGAGTHYYPVFISCKPTEGTLFLSFDEGESGLRYRSREMGLIVSGRRFSESVEINDGPNGVGADVTISLEAPLARAFGTASELVVEYEGRRFVLPSGSFRQAVREFAGYCGIL